MLVCLPVSARKMYHTFFALLPLILFSQLVTAQIVTGDTSVCAGEKVYYSVTPSGNSYSWNVTGGTVSGNPNNDTVTIIWGPAGSGNITTTIFTNAGPLYANLAVTIHALPNPSIVTAPYLTCPTSSSGTQGGSGQPDGGSDCAKVCEFATLSYSTALNAGSTYLWVITGASGFTGQGTNAVNVTWNASLNGSITVIETNVWGCIDSAEICVEKVSRPIAQFTAQSSVCLNTGTTFTNQSSGATTFQWNFGDNTTSNAVNPTHAYTSAGTFTVTLIAFNACFCSDTFQQTITVDSLPGPEITCPSTVCAGDTQTYQTNLPGCTYQWGSIGGTILGSSTSQQVTVAWGPGALGTLWLYVTGCSGLCTDTTFAYIPIVGANDTIVGPKKACSPGCYDYSVTFYSGATYTWSVGGAGVITQQSCNDVEICWPAFYQGNDTLTVTYYDSFLGCGGSATMIVKVRSEMSIFGQSPVCVNSLSGYNVNPSVPCQWNIYPAGPIILGNGSPNININWNNQPGTYLLSAIPLNPNAVCNDSAVIQITVLPKPLAPDITGDTIVCPNTIYSYCSSASGQVNWLITGGTPTASIGSCVTVTWGGTGPYVVRAFVQMNGSPYCSSDTTVLNVYSALPLPVPNVTAPSVACANGTSNFTCTTAYPAGATYNWSINLPNAGAVIGGQGTPAATIEWGNNTGAVTVTLTVTVCSQQITKNITLTLLPPPVPVINQIGILCPGVPAQLNVTGGAFTGYNWSGPGGYSSNINPTTITQGGIYHVTVTATSGCTAHAQFTAVPQPAPLASISTSDLLHYCFGQSFAVTLNAMSNPGYTYNWSNGPNSNPNVVTSAGTYWVTVTDANGCTAQSNFITINQDSCNGSGPGVCQPNGSISFNHPAFYGCNPVSFTNTSVNGSSYTWNFGDNTFSNAINPTHTYAQAGFYLVTLSGYVPNVAGTDSCLLTDTAHVQIPLAPDFKYVKGCLGTPVVFTDLSTFTVGNNITSWAWNFGDAGTSTSQNPTHIYSSAGTYVVTLTVGNGTCTSTITDTLIIPPLPVAAFSSPASACVNSSVSFTDLSTPAGALNGWSWAFGDAGTSLNQNPTHAYNATAVYGILLTVTDTLGCTDTASASINIINPLPIGSIAAYPDSIVCAGTPVLLVAPFCTGCTYQWLPGNSTNDSIIVSATGIYTVKVTDPNGCTSSTSIAVVVNPAPPAIIYNSGSNEICLGDFASLSTTYSVNYLYYWTSNDTFSNGNTTNAVFCNSPSLGVGTYNYQVAITDTTTGCSDTSLTYTIIVHPLPVPPSITVVGSSTICEGDTVMLIGSHPDSTVTLQWSTGQVTDTIFATLGGNYILTATDTNGCESKDTAAIIVNPLPDVCSFWTGCLDTCGPFTIYAPYGAAAYQWLKNDSILPGETGPSYMAMVNGSYSVILTSAFGCIDTAGPLNLTLYECDSICAELVIDSLGCDTNGHHVIYYHVINTSGHPINEMTIAILPPHHNTIYGPVSVYQTIPNNASSSVHSITFYTANTYDTICFKAYVHEIDSFGMETFCCNTDTECVVLPPCPEDTSHSIGCCYLGFVETGVMCHPTPIGYDYLINLNIDACGKLFIQLPDTGSINVTNPYLLNGPGTINFTYSSLTPQSHLCLTFVLYDSTGAYVCKDTTMCFPLNCDTGNTTPTCNYSFSDTLCQGQSTVFNYNGPTAGYTFNWTFTGGSPSSATGPGPHTVTYAGTGCFPVMLVITGNNVQISCPDTICVFPPPVATVNQVGNTMYAYPAGMTYQWYVGPPNWQLLSGEVNQFYTPSFSTLFCVEVSNGAGCKDTACIDHQWNGINDPALQSIRVYPSPADDWLKVNANFAEPLEAEIKLVNGIGAVVYERQLQTGTEVNVNVPLTALPSGIYLLQLKAGGVQFVERVFVQHH